MGAESPRRRSGSPLAVPIVTSYHSGPEGRITSWVGEQPLYSSSNENLDSDGATAGAAGSARYPAIPDPDYSPTAAGAAGFPQNLPISSDRARYRGESVSPRSTLRPVASFYDNVPSPQSEDYSNSTEQREYSIEPNRYGGVTYSEVYTKETQEVNTYDLRTNPAPVPPPAPISPMSSRPSPGYPEFAEVWQPQKDGSPPWAQQQPRKSANEREHDVKIVTKPNNVTWVEINAAVAAAPDSGGRQTTRGHSFSKRQTAL